MRSRRWGLWAWAVAAPVILVTVLLMRAELGACTATFGFGKDEIQAANCFEFWLNRYQTMISGLLALSAAVVAYLAAKLQIRHAERLEEKKRQAEEYAARARLPFVLSEISRYAGYYMDQFLSRLETPNDRSPLLLLRVPIGGIDSLQACIRVAGKVQAKKLADLLAFLQFFESNIKSYSSCRTMTVYEIVINATILHILSFELLDYGRRTEEGFLTWPDSEKIGYYLLKLGLTKERHPKLHILLDPVQGSGASMGTSDEDDLVNFQVGWKS